MSPSPTFEPGASWPQNGHRGSTGAGSSQVGSSWAYWGSSPCTQPMSVSFWIGRRQFRQALWSKTYSVAMGRTLNLRYEPGSRPQLLEWSAIADRLGELVGDSPMSGRERQCGTTGASPRWQQAGHRCGRGGTRSGSGDANGGRSESGRCGCAGTCDHPCPDAVPGVPAVVPGVPLDARPGLPGGGVHSPAGAPTGEAGTAVLDGRLLTRFLTVRRKPQSSAVARIGHSGPIGRRHSAHHQCFWPHGSGQISSSSKNHGP